MTNFGILTEFQEIDKPFEWARKVIDGTGLYYSPTRKPSTTYIRR